MPIGTVILVLLKRRSSAALSKIKRKNRKRVDSNKEVAVFVTVAMMQIEFAINISKDSFCLELCCEFVG